MFALLIEIQRGEAWNLVQTVNVPSYPGDPDRQRGRKAAVMEARRALGSWQSYFVGDRLRIREVG